MFGGSEAMNYISPQQQEGPATSRAIRNIGTTATNVNTTTLNVQNKSALVSEEEQRVSSTSSPAQHHQHQQSQNLNSNTNPIQINQNLTLIAARLQQENVSSPALITSTTASPPQPMRDDEEQTHRHQSMVVAATTKMETENENENDTEIETEEVVIVSSPGAETDGSISISGSSQQEMVGLLQPNEMKRKIILKLPNPINSRSHESHMDLEPTTSSSCSNSSSCNNDYNIIGTSTQDDPRRVEPIRIHLPNAASASTASVTTCPAAACISPTLSNALSATTKTTTTNNLSPTVPKLTIKHIKKQNDVVAALTSDASSCSCSSSCAEEELNICCNNRNADIPHILPKLTIRAASTNEGRGKLQTTVVPKLVIKMPDNCVVNNNAMSNSEKLAKNLNTNTRQLDPPPLPKLTIKTALDGTSESIISSLSPASASPTTTSSAASSASCSPHVVSASSQNVTIATKNAVGGAQQQQLQQQLVPKLTIKQLQKKVTCDDASGSSNSGSNSMGSTIPKLTIKTTQNTTSCITTPNAADECTNSLPSDVTEHTSNKIPKMTIKTGQEHTVIMTHDVNNAQSIPKLTIKTRSFDVDDTAPFSNEQQQHMQPPEKMARMSIKELDAGSDCFGAIPKLTFSVGGGGMASVVRQSTASATGSTCVERVPKLMITRQHDGFVNNCNEQQQIVGDGAATVDMNTTTTTTSLTTTTMCSSSNSSSSSSSSSSSNESIVNDANSSESILKLKLNPNSEDVVISASETPVTQYHVPKLTIKNLCSPKHKVRAVLEEKCTKMSVNVNTLEVVSTKTYNVNKKGTAIEEPFINGGESSSSQEFCGFNDIDADIDADADADPAEARRNSDDMDIDDALQQEHDPKMFHNLPLATKNGEHVPLAIKQRPQQEHVIDTVDLTSSPSPGSSPAYNLKEAATEAVAAKGTPTKLDSMNMPILTKSLQQNSLSTCSNILLSQLTGPQRNFTKSKALSSTLHDNMTHSSAALKYPQLTERLLANGSTLGGLSAADTAKICCNKMFTKTTDEINKNTKIIDSIEILDTPEGSPQPAATQHLQQCNEQLHNHVLSNKKQIHQNDDSCTSADVALRINNNTMIDPALDDLGNIKRHTMATQKLLMEQINSTVLTNDQMRMDVETNHNTSLSYAEQNAPGAGAATSPVLQNELLTKEQKANSTNISATTNHHHHRSRKQKHDHILNTELDDALFSNANNLVSDYYNVTNNNTDEHVVTNANAASDAFVTAVAISASGLVGINGVYEAALAVTTPTAGSKRRGRPKRNMPATTQTAINQIVDIELAAGENTTSTLMEEHESTSAVKSRRVQLLRKRLAIDMVSSEQPPHADILADADTTAAVTSANNDNDETHANSKVKNVFGETRRRQHRPLRASRRCGIPNKLLSSLEKGTRKRRSTNGNGNDKAELNESISDEINDNATAASTLTNHFGLLDQSSSSSSVATHNSLTLTTAMSTQIDLTMCSSSSSASNCSNSLTTVTTTSSSSTSSLSTSAPNVGLTTGNSSNASSMLPPVKILSSSDPVPDVVFKPNDFSSIIATQQFHRIEQQDYQDDSHNMRVESYDDVQNSFILSTTPPSSTRGRGRGRGSRGGRGSVGAAVGSSSNGRGGSATRAPRLGRGASAVAKAIAMSRPRCVGGLKHTPDPERLKELFSPAPQVFEEDTRMSADFSSTTNVTLMEPPLTPQKQDFLSNEESQSSVISNTSILDTSTMVFSAKRLKKKKMEVCASEDVDFNASTIAEYDWPPPKGCCPSKNRDTFMIQEQVALYLGIKSFKRKYPDLPRRAVDMEERNWLQEKGLVSEKMCDLGITAVWASDILDIMYADFYDKYEEYKEYIRQKHLREIEAKQKALGLNVGNGRGMQARDRAMLSASKWNAYLNKTRKDERLASLDLQTFTMNLPLPRTAAFTIMQTYRPTIDQIAADVAAAVQTDDDEHVENIFKPTNLLNSALCDTNHVDVDFDFATAQDNAYPLSLVPGQFTTKYRHYTPLELRSYPINTVLDDPITLPQRILQQQKQELEEQQQEMQQLDFEQQLLYDNKCSGNVFECNDESDENSTIASHERKRIPIRRSRRARQQITTRKKQHNVTEESDNLNNNTVASNENQLAKNAYKRSYAVRASSTSGSSDHSGSSSNASDSDSETSTSSSTSSSDDDDNYNDDDENLNALHAKCGVCQRTQHTNKRFMPELFVQCYTCRRNVHPSCIDMPHRMVTRVRNYNWQCAECKCCIKCKQKQEPNKMLYCEQCDRGYHIYCLGVKTVPDGRWSCERCSFCMRCGANKPEGLPLQQQQHQHGQASPNGEKVRTIKHKKVKWINEYRIDHITNLREHCSMLCVPCARIKPTKRTTPAMSGGAATLGNCMLSPGMAKTTTITTNTVAVSATTTILTTNAANTNTLTTSAAITSALAAVTTAATACGTTKISATAALTTTVDVYGETAAATAAAVAASGKVQATQQQSQQVHQQQQQNVTLLRQMQTQMLLKTTKQKLTTTPMTASTIVGNTKNSIAAAATTTEAATTQEATVATSTQATTSTTSTAPTTSVPSAQIVITPHPVVA